MPQGLKQSSRLTAIEDRLDRVESQLIDENAGHPVIVPINTFAPDALDILKEFKVIVQQDEEEFTAIFFDANISATGCNQIEAVENLKDLVVSRFLYLSEQPPAKLGPGLARQLAVLREFVRRRM